MKLCLKHLKITLLEPNQEDACLVLTGAGGGVQCSKSDGEGEEASGFREHSPPRATVVLVLSRKGGRQHWGRGWPGRARGVMSTGPGQEQD